MPWWSPPHPRARHKCPSSDEPITPLPTTFAGLQLLPGPSPSGPCEVSSPPPDTVAVTSISLPDTSHLLLVAGWQQQPLVEGDQGHTEARLAGPADARISISRMRNGAQGRHFLIYRSGVLPEGRACWVRGGSAGAIWASYEPDPGVPDDPRPFLAFGELITPAGRWYRLTVSSRTAQDRDRAASTITALFLRQRQ